MKKKIKILFYTCCILAIVLVVQTVLHRSERNRYTEMAEHAGLLPPSWAQEMKVKCDSERCIGEYRDYRIYFTLNAGMQETAEKLLQQYNPAMGIFVVVSPRTGAILTMAAHARSTADESEGNSRPSFLLPLIRSSDYPMASLIKLVTASAAIERGIFTPETRMECRGEEQFGGGVVRDAGGVVHGKVSLTDALGYSCNSVLARVAVKIGKMNLEQYLRKFLIGTKINFDLPLLESGYKLGNSEYSLGSTGAGFGDVYISPIHAALIAATIKNRGTMMQPYLIERINRGGKVIHRKEPKVLARPVKKRTAALLARMMEATVHRPHGTAYKGFYKNGKYIAAPFRVAGKTGSLNGKTPSEEYTWMIGFADGKTDDFAFACLIMNDESWKIKAASFSGQFFMHYASSKKNNPKF